MVNYGIPVWQLVLDASKEVSKPFSSVQIIKKIREKHPNVNAKTINCYVIGMAPNHPSSKYYPSANQHPVFNYLGNGTYDLIENKNKESSTSKIKVIDNKDLEVPTWSRIDDKIGDLQNYITLFRVEFIDRDSFKKFCDNLLANLSVLKEISITGYFSETVRKELEILAKNNGCHIRIISPDFSVGTPREKKNLEALRKLAVAGIEVKFNSRMHARMLIAQGFASALLVLGSFDFNTECIGKERYDAGIKTSHPELVKSAAEFFNQVWNDSETQTLEQFLKDKKINP